MEIWWRVQTRQVHEPKRAIQLSWKQDFSWVVLENVGKIIQLNWPKKRCNITIDFGYLITANKYNYLFKVESKKCNLDKLLKH